MAGPLPIPAMMQELGDQVGNPVCRITVERNASAHQKQVESYWPLPGRLIANASWHGYESKDS